MSKDIPSPDLLPFRLDALRQTAGTAPDIDGAVADDMCSDLARALEIENASWSRRKGGLEPLAAEMDGIRFEALARVALQLPAEPAAKVEALEAAAQAALKAIRESLSGALGAQSPDRNAIVAEVARDFAWTTSRRLHNRWIPRQVPILLVWEPVEPSAAAEAMTKWLGGHAKVRLETDAALLGLRSAIESIEKRTTPEQTSPVLDQLRARFDEAYADCVEQVCAEGWAEVFGLTPEQRAALPEVLQAMPADLLARMHELEQRAQSARAAAVADTSDASSGNTSARPSSPVDMTFEEFAEGSGRSFVRRALVPSPTAAK
ncbi:MAG: hypothetical protein JNL80_03040 [Phycisphaerae bacterium]|nr:hypothetical protein [Phycisphaerae bacterium]